MTLPNIGDIWDSKYRIERVLGEGGMGIVFEAYHLRLEQNVAIKCLLPEFAGKLAVTARFEREARAAARLRSRHVVKILDVETHPNGVPYMVMELMRGRDLENELLLRGEIPYAELCDWLVQASGALAEAHNAGIVHRDLKPSNIFLAEEPGDRIAKVLDFGIAKSSAIVPGITYTVEGGGGICGTPNFMSPEQITDADIDGRSDVWSLGIVAYELLAQRSAFEAASFPALSVKIVNSDPTPLHEIRADLPRDLCDSIMKALKKDRSKRFANMTEFAEALAPYGTRTDLLRWSHSQVASGSLSLRSLPVTPESRSSALEHAATTISREVPASTLVGQTLANHKPASSKKWLLVGVGVAALVSVVGGLFVLQKPHSAAQTDMRSSATTTVTPLAVTATANVGNTAPASTQTTPSATATPSAPLAGKTPKQDPNGKKPLAGAPASTATAAPPATVSVAPAPVHTPPPSKPSAAPPTTLL
jgi:eukaryotic-like serine/threonine-protein kinase